MSLTTTNQTTVSWTQQYSFTTSIGSASSSIEGQRSVQDIVNEMAWRAETLQGGAFAVGQKLNQKLIAHDVNEVTEGDLLHFINLMKGYMTGRNTLFNLKRTFFSLIARANKLEQHEVLHRLEKVLFMNLDYPTYNSIKQEALKVALDKKQNLVIGALIDSRSVCHNEPLHTAASCGDFPRVAMLLTESNRHRYSFSDLFLAAHEADRAKNSTSYRLKCILYRAFSTTVWSSAPVCERCQYEITLKLITDFEPRLKSFFPNAGSAD